MQKFVFTVHAENLREGMVVCDPITGYADAVVTEVVRHPVRMAVVGRTLGEGVPFAASLYPGQVVDAFCAPDCPLAALRP